MALAEPEEDPRRVEIADQVELLLIARSEARSAKDWSKADEIRDELKQRNASRHENKNLVPTASFTPPSAGAPSSRRGWLAPRYT